MTIQDLSIYEESLFLNYKSKGLTDTQAALQIALDKITAKISQSGSEITRQQLNEYKRLIKEEISKSYDGLYAAMQDESVKAAELVGSYMAVTTKKIPTKVIDDLINSKRNILGYEFQELFKIQSENHERALRVVLGSGVAQGLPANEIVKTLIDKSESLGKGQLVTAVNSTIKDSRENARYARYKEYETQGIVKGYMYDATLDGRTSGVCRANSNRKFMVKLEDVPLDAKPPLHPNCRSVLTVISTNEYTDNVKSSMFGETKNESYPEWLKNLPEDKQKIVLGKKYQAYKDGRYTIKSLADVKGVAIHSMDDISKAMNDAVKAPEVPEIKFGYDGKFDGYVADIRPEAKMVIDKFPKPEKIRLTKKSGRYNKDLSVLETSNDPYVFRHEYGHHLDANIIKEMKIGKFSIKSSITDLKGFKAAYDSDYNNYASRDISLVTKMIDESGYKKGESRAAGISDIFDSFKNGAIQRNGYAGHGYAYADSDGLKRRETFANLFELWSSNLEWNRTKELFPNITSEFEKIMKEVIDGKFD